MINRRTKQQGVVLVIALIVLLMITMIGLSGVKSGVLESYASVNEEERSWAYNTAQGALDKLEDDDMRNHLIITGRVGDIVACSDNLTCSNRAINFASSGLDTTGEIEVVRIFPEDVNTPPMPDKEFSAKKFRANFFQATAEQGAVGDAHGRARITQGYMRLRVQDSIY